MGIEYDFILAEFKPVASLCSAVAAVTEICAKCGYFPIKEPPSSVPDWRGLENIVLRSYVRNRDGLPDSEVQRFKWPDLPNIVLPEFGFMHFWLFADPPCPTTDLEDHDNLLVCEMRVQQAAGVDCLELQLYGSPFTHRLFDEPAISVFGRAIMICHELALRFDTDRVRILKGEGGWVEQGGESLPESDRLLYAVPTKKT